MRDLYQIYKFTVKHTRHSTPLLHLYHQKTCITFNQINTMQQIGFAGNFIFEPKKIHELNLSHLAQNHEQFHNPNRLMNEIPYEKEIHPYLYSF